MRLLSTIARIPVIRAVLLAVFLFCCAHGMARAETLPQPWAPWMEAETDSAARPLPPPQPARFLQSSRDSQSAPSPRQRLAPSLTRTNVPLAENGGNALANPSTLSDSDWETLRQELLETSALERMYSGRIVDRLSQFGYDLFRNEARQNAAAPPMPAGAAQDNVLLNFGDKVQITFRGQRDDQKIYMIDNEGLLIVPDLAPIPAAGRSLGALRETLEAETQRFHNTNVFVSLVAVQRINVLVVGHVIRPGRQTLTAFNTVLDALTAAGGIEKTGTLRQVKLVRQGRSTLIDLYGLLVYGGGAADLMLQDGDRLIVPPIGPTVAISGEVKRPGIYEILPLPRGMDDTPERGSEKLSLDEMLDLSGGVLAPGRNRFLKLEITRSGEDSTEDVTDGGKPLFGDGSILVISHGVDKRSGSIELLGHTRRPGLYALDDAPTLRRLLDADGVLGPDIYPLIGVIARRDPDLLTTSFLDFPLRLVMGGKADKGLRDGDRVYLFSTAQIRRLETVTPETEGRLDALDSAPVEQGSADPGEEGEGRIDDPALRSFLREHAVRLRGAVRSPGAWPVAEGASLDTLLAAAGGMSLDADAASIEITSSGGSGTLSEKGDGKGRGGARRIMVSFGEKGPETVRISPGDTIRINSKPRRNEEKTVHIVGEVAHPGVYDLLPGEHLSSLLGRAGGITPDAYPAGAIFSRESERRAEESRFKAAARDLERSIAIATDDGRDERKKPDVAELSLARDLASQLRQAQAVGRITVEADPGILGTRPELDILLESGDRVYIPKRPLTVRVTGEVLSPAALQFRSGKDARDYIDEAGGFTFNADKDRVFVVYPDGSAQPLSVDIWNHRTAMIPPGSSIVVPRDPKPFDFIESAEKISQIVSNLALTGIWLDDLRGD